MATITVSADLLSPPDRIWPQLLNYDRYPEWLVVHDSFASPPPEQPVAGDTFVQRGTLMGMSGELEWTFEEVVVARRILITADTPVNALLRVTFLLEPYRSGSRMTCVYEVIGLRVAGLLIRAANREARRNTLKSLKRLDALSCAGPSLLEDAG
jgi:hypothetical protein